MKKIIIIFISVLVLLGIIGFGVYMVQQRQLENAIALEQERVNRISTIVFWLGGDFKLEYTDDGIPTIEYTLETTLAQIRLGGLNAEFGLTQGEVWEILAENAENPLYDEIASWLLAGYLHNTPQGKYIIVLTRIVNENFTYFQETFPYDVVWEEWAAMGAAQLPVNVVQEAIRLEAEQRYVQSLITSRD